MRRGKRALQAEVVHQTSDNALVYLTRVIDDAPVLEWVSSNESTLFRRNAQVVYELQVVGRSGRSATGGA